MSPIRTPAAGSRYSIQGCARRKAVAWLTLRWNAEPTSPPAAPVRWAISTHLIKLRMVCMTSFVSLFTEIMVKASNYNRIFLGTTHSIVRAERKYQTNFKK